MSEFELSHSYHQFFQNSFGKSYIQGYSWYGHNQVPSLLKSGQLNFIAIVSDEVDYEEIRYQIASFHHAHASKVHLCCIHQHSFIKFLMLNPTVAHRLNRCESFGSSISNIYSGNDESPGWIAWQTMQATADIYTDKSNNIRLRSLLPPADSESKTNHAMLAQLQKQMGLGSNDEPEIHTIPAPIKFHKPASIYLKLDQLILVSYDPAEAFNRLNQCQVEEWMEENSASAVQFCSPTQLLQAVSTEDLVSARLMSYQHVWGEELLKNLRFNKNEILLGAAKAASYWQLYGMSSLLFSPPVSIEHDRKIIHDLQNRLLNIRLQNELFSHFKLAPKGIPTIAIPDRSAPVSLRLKAIENLFDWWTNFYLDLSSKNEE